MGTDAKKHTHTHTHTQTHTSIPDPTSSGRSWPNVGEM